MRLRFFIFCWSIALMLLSTSRAQHRTYNLIHFSAESGLPSNEVRGLATDAQGIVWISTNKGLAFYDGKQIHHIPFNQLGLGFTNDLGKIAIDAHGRIWMATDNQGLLCYDKRKPLDKSITYYPVRLDQSILKNELYEIFASKSGLIYFGGQEMDLQVLDPNTQKIKRVVFPLSKKDGALNIYCIREDSRGILWIGTRYEGFFSYDPRSGSIKNFNLNQPDENAVSSFVFRKNEIYSMYYDHDLVKYMPKNGSLKANLLGEQKCKEFYDNAYPAMIFDPNRDEIIAGHVSKGITVYKPETGQQQQIKWSELCPKCELPIKVNVMLKTNNGYWLGTTNGLFWYEESMNKVNQLVPADKEPIIDVFKIGNNLWYRTAYNFGLLSTDLKKKLSTFSLNGIKMSQINVIDGVIYFSSFYNGLFYFDTAQKQAIRPLKIIGNKFGFDFGDCNTVLKDTIDSKLFLWIGTWNNGLYRYDLSNKTIVRYDKSKGLPSNKIVNMGRDNDQSIWLGMDGHGLIQLLDKKKFRWRQFVQLKEHGGLPSNKVIAFSPGHRDTLWCSTGASGLSAITKKNNTVFIQYYPDKNDFPHNFVNDIKRDQLGRLWLRSNDGLMVFDPSTKSFVQLAHGKGIIPPLPVKTYAVSLVDNDLILCTSNGLLRTGLKNLNFKSAVLEKPLFSKFHIANKDYSHLLFHGPTVELRPEENSFAIDISHPDAALREYIFAYRLKDVDPDWVVGKEDPQAVYNNLPGGNYIFEAKLGDKYGQWSPEIARLNIQLQSKWFETVWFKTLVLLTGIGIVIGVFLFRLRQQKKINEIQLAYTNRLQDELAANERKIKEQAKILEIEKEEKLEADFRKKLIESELKAIRSQMNPHFIFNVFNSIEAYVIDNDSKSASHLIHKFATLSRIVLENSRSSLVKISSELHLIKLYLELEQDRFAYSFSFEIHVDPHLDIHDKKIPSMLIQPLIENAVHHGIRHLVDRRGKIRINLMQTPTSIQIEVLDNGVGFDQAQQTKHQNFKTTSFGLKGVHDRLSLLNDKSSDRTALLTVTSLPQEHEFSTMISISLPVIRLNQED